MYAETKRQFKDQYLLQTTVRGTSKHVLCDRSFQKRSTLPSLMQEIYVVQRGRERTIFFCIRTSEGGAGGGGGGNDPIRLSTILS